MVRLSYTAVMVRGLFGVCATLLMTAALADEPQLELTPFITYRGGGQFKDGAGETIDLSAGKGMALAVNWRAADPGTQYELFYSRQATDTDNSPPVAMKLEYLHVGGTTLLSEPSARVVPFAVGGLGATRLTPGAGLGDETRWSLNLGGGIRVPIVKQVRLRFEARGYLTWLGGGTDLFCQAGCVLGAKSKTLFQYEALGGVSISF